MDLLAAQETEAMIIETHSKNASAANVHNVFLGMMVLSRIAVFLVFLITLTLCNLKPKYTSLLRVFL